MLESWWSFQRGSDAKLFPRLCGCNLSIIACAFGLTPPILFFRALELMALAEDGELRVFDELGRGRVAMMSDDEVVNEVVKGGAEIMETVADDEAKLCGDWLGKPDVYELLAALAVDKTDVSVRFSLSPLKNLRVKCV